MGAALKVPTVFTAVNAVSAVVKTIANDAGTAASRIGKGFNEANKSVNGMLAPLNKLTAGLFSFLSTAALVAAITAGVWFSVDSIKEYEKAVASFRTIVSDLSDRDFAKYKNAIGAVATETKKSTIEVAQSFEKIAGLNADFAKTAAGLSAVSAAAITLSKASGADLGPSAENLVGIMNQFDLAANQANRTINVLAAGQAVGAASISQTSEAFVNAGSTLSGANVSLEQSVALIQTLGRYSIFGAEAGTKLRGAISKLQGANVGYKSGQFQINDALVDMKAKLDKLKTAKAKDAMLTKVFGLENVTAGRILLANIDTYKQFTASVTGTQEAQKAAAINSNTLGTRLDELKAKWVNLITTNEQSNAALDTAKGALAFVAHNLGTIVTIIGTAIGLYTAYTALNWGLTAVTWAYNVAAGVRQALDMASLVCTNKSIVAQKAYMLTTKAITAAIWLWEAAQTGLNIVMAMNPIGLIVAAVIALIALTVVVIKKWNEWGAALTLILGPFGLLISLVQSFRNNWDNITKAFKEGGIIAGIKAIGATIFDAILYPIQQSLQLLGKIPGLGIANTGAAAIKDFRAGMGINTTTPATTPVVNTRAAEQASMEKTINNNIQKEVKVKFENMPAGTTVSGNGVNDIMPSVGSTQSRN